MSNSSNHDLPQLIVIALRDETSSHVELMRGHVRDFEQHGRDEINAFHQLEIDVHVEGNLTLALQLLLLGSPLETALPFP